MSEMKEHKKNGRPTSYTKEIADKLFDLMGEGISVRKIILQNDDMPNRASIFRWMDAIPNFRDQYESARLAQAEAFMDEIQDLADDVRIGTRKVTKPSGEEVTEYDMIERTRLQVETRKWIASKVVPKKYGDKVQTEVTGQNGGAILITASQQDESL